jgi:predicted RNA-binding Zn ribbon-like protein
VAHPIELVLPAEPAPVRLMNTVWADRAGVHDALVDVGDLRLFLRAVGAADLDEVTPGDLVAARRLREALRRLAADITDDDRPRAATGMTESDATTAVNTALASLPRPRLRRTARGWLLGVEDGNAVDAALAAVARGGAALVADLAQPLRACHAPGCVLYFVRDHPRREWCGVACGNRARAARHYRRSRALDGSATNGGVAG